MVDTFKLGDKTICIDPCYDTLEDGGIVFNTLPGNYRAFIRVRPNVVGPNMVSELSIVHEDYADNSSNEDTATVRFICVDSGQAGFFDSKVWESDMVAGAENKNKFYLTVCRKSSSPMRGGMGDGYVVASPYHGDGSYAVRLVYNDNYQVIRASILFDDHADTETMQLHNTTSNKA